MWNQLKQFTWGWVWLGGFLALSVLLNMQLTEASNIHTGVGGHDEYLTVRQVYSIVESPDWKHRFMAIIAGEKLYYGRVMFYTDAAIAWLPYQLGGVEAMVFAIRMTHALILGLALLILSITFLSSLAGRISFLVFGSLLSYTFYFIMMPKPEPYQLLFLALFFYTWNKDLRGWGVAFFWLGMAFGAKFNILFTIPLVIYLTWETQRIQWLPLMRSIGYFVLGWVVAIPCLALAVVKPIFLKTYIQQTLLNTGQIDDDPTIHAGKWLIEGYSTQYLGGEWIWILFVFIVGGIGWFEFNKRRKSDYLTHSGITLLMGLALFIPVVFLTKRIWGHYIWEAHLFFLLTYAQLFWDKEKPISRIGQWASLGLAAWGAIWFSTTQSVGFFGLNKRFQGEKESYEKAWNKVLAENHNAVMYLGQGVWYPFKEFVKVNPYHPFSGSVGTVMPRVEWEQGDSSYSYLSPGNYVLVKEGGKDVAMINKLENMAEGGRFAPYILYQKNNTKP